MSLRFVNKSLVLSLASLIFLGACGSFDRATQSMANALTLYRPEVVQGNFISSEQVNALHAGMTRLQVRDLLGTPMLSDIFHEDRWDYVFTIKRRGVEAQHYQLTLFFSGDILKHFDSDDMPSEAEFVDSISPSKKHKIPQLEASPEELERFANSHEDKSLDNTRSQQPTPAPAGNYPPLE